MYVPLKALREAPEGETSRRQLRVAGRPASADELESLGERLSAPVPVVELLQKHTEENQPIVSSSNACGSFTASTGSGGTSSS